MKRHFETVGTDLSHISCRRCAKPLVQIALEMCIEDIEIDLAPVAGAITKADYHWFIESVEGVLTRIREGVKNDPEL